MNDKIKICDVVDNCEDCPKYADDCDGDKRMDEPFRKPLVYNPHTAERKIAELEAKVDKLTKENTNLKIHLRILTEDSKK